jgi:hypothetical protein
MNKIFSRKHLLLSLCIGLVVGAVVCDLVTTWEEQSRRRAPKILCDRNGRVYDQNGAPIERVFGDGGETTQEVCPKRW